MECVSKKMPLILSYTKIWWSNSSFPWRPAEDVAFAVSRFIQNNGSFFNDYMLQVVSLPLVMIMMLHWMNMGC
ncbi:hypothetical protein P3L10_021176 [Capsicum annuum]